MSTVIISLILIGIVGLIIRTMYRDKKAGKRTCGYGCAGCASAGVCCGHHQTENRNKK